MRVMTWNLWWRFGDWRERMKAIRAVLDKEQPDIVGLQEVWADNSTDLAAWLAGELGMYSAYGAPSDQKRWRERVNDESVSFGVGVLSRWPIEDEQVFDLPQDASRLMLSVMVQAPHAKVPFVTTHLSALPLGASARRWAQLEFVAKHVAGMEVTEHPPIVVGDFNAEPESDEVRKFGGNLTAPFVDGQVFLDAWRFADPADPGFTWNRANPYVAQWIEPSSRIDYIHVAGRAAPLGILQSARLAATGPIDGIWPSDHAAVIAELRHDH